MKSRENQQVVVTGRSEKANHLHVLVCNLCDTISGDRLGAEIQVRFHI